MRTEQLLHPDTLAAILRAPFASPAAGTTGKMPLVVPAAGLAPGGEMRLRVLTVRREPLAGGVSGAHLERVLVEIEVGQAARQQRLTIPLVFKRLRPDESWLLRASGDTRCREVQLWQHGLLADMPRALCAPVLAAAYDDKAADEETRTAAFQAARGGEGTCTAGVPAGRDREETCTAGVPAGRGVEGALLLADMRRWLGRLEDCFAPVAPARLAQYLDHLARLHAHYWEDARLKDARFALASVEQTLLMLAPATIEAQLAAGDAHPYLPISQSGWKAFFAYSPSDALARIQRIFAAPAPFLASAAQAPATLVHGDAWPPNMGILPGERGFQGRHAGGRTILIDWALATAGPASFDPLWLLFAWRKVDTRLGLLAYRQRLMQHLARRGIALSAEQWRLLVDLGVVRTVLTCGETMGQDILFANNESQRARAIAALGRWTRWAARAIERRGWDQ